MKSVTVDLAVESVFFVVVDAAEHCRQIDVEAIDSSATTCPDV